jgi:hypothetical protein
MEIKTEKMWFSEKEAAEYTSFCRSVIGRDRLAGKITYRTYGRKIIYNRDDLDKFIERNTQLIKSVEDHMSQYRQRGSRKTNVKK